jgi:hypothetical protein
LYTEICLYRTSLGPTFVFRRGWIFVVGLEESTEICRCATLSLDEPLAAGAETIFGAGL